MRYLDVSPISFNLSLPVMARLMRFACICVSLLYPHQSTADCYSDPGNVCNDGYMDRTKGNSNRWSCASDCPGGIYRSDSICRCACIPASECIVNITNFLIYQVTMNWTDANQYCAHTFGTQLATIKSDDDATALLDYAESTDISIWIGLHRNDSDGLWQWISGYSCDSTDSDCSTLDYWLDGHPENDDDSDSACAQVRDSLLGTGTNIDDLLTNGRDCSISGRNFVACDPVLPTVSPTALPTANPTTSPTINPSLDPSSSPSIDPTTDPTMDPSTDPTADPTTDPSTDPTTIPTITPSQKPSKSPSTEPTPFPDESGSESVSQSGSQSDSVSESEAATISILPFSDSSMVIVVIALSLIICCLVIILVVILNRTKKSKSSSTADLKVISEIHAQPIHSESDRKTADTKKSVDNTLDIEMGNTSNGIDTKGDINLHRVETLDVIGNHEMKEGIASTRNVLETEGGDDDIQIPKMQHLATPSHLKMDFSADSESAECLYGGDVTAGQEVDHSATPMGPGLAENVENGMISENRRETGSGNGEDV